MQKMLLWKLAVIRVCNTIPMVPHAIITSPTSVKIILGNEIISVFDKNSYLRFHPLLTSLKIEQPLSIHFTRLRK